MDATRLVTLYISFFLGMLAFSMLINHILFKFFKTLGTKNQTGISIRWNSQAKPAIGGFSFYIIFLISLISYTILFNPEFDLINSSLLGLFIAGTLGFVLGLTDDAYNTRPLLKFSVQILCGVILTLTHSQIEIMESSILNHILTVIWVVGIMNSINMLDNMDGVAASVTSFILVAALGYMIMNETYTGYSFIICIGVLASLVGFLYFNWYPSKMFMGDTGSQFLGLILGYIGIHYGWNAQNIAGETNLFFSLAAILLIFVLPISDTLTVTINRLRRGQSPFVGGRDHTTHNLSYLGFSDNQVAGVFCGIATLSVVFFLLFINFTYSTTLSIGLSIIYFSTVFGLLFGITEYNKIKNRKAEHRDSKSDL